MLIGDEADAEIRGLVFYIFFFGKKKSNRKIKRPGLIKSWPIGYKGRPNARRSTFFSNGWRMWKAA